MEKIIKPENSNNTMEKVSKGWGHEIIIHNDEKYCGKLLFMYAGKMLSWHYHRLKTETFFLGRGKVTLLWSYEDDINKAEEVILTTGGSYHIPVGMRHRLIAHEDTEIFEFSTQHWDSDSIRIIKGN